MWVYMMFFFCVSGFQLIDPTKLCINCKNFIGDKLNPLFGKCKLFTKQNSNHLVTGEKKQNQYCSISRDDENMCGESGKKYIKLRKNKEP